MAGAYNQRPSELVTLRHALPVDHLRFDLAVMLWASTEEALLQWEARKQQEQRRG